jgi:hypothetical protein
MVTDDDDVLESFGVVEGNFFCRKDTLNELYYSF